MLITLGLAASIALPLIGALCLTLAPFSRERTAARIAICVTWASSIASLATLIAWALGGAGQFQTAQYVLFSHGDYRFTLGLLLDPAAAVFLLLVQFTSGMVIRFSRTYMHREPGFRRFFAVVLMFRGAMCLLTLADNLDLLFVGWELVGLASFLLIAFYFERRQAVRNALKIFSIYRVADVGMLLGAYLEHTSGRTGIGFLLLLAAAGKSAQFPFSFWIARAMEGPTPSSALFYGALSVHAGAYLLLRTYSIWGGVPLVHVCIGVLGLVTAILCTLFSRTQHTIKGQVGYASVTQVGLIFVELAFGLRWLALIHITANALLRCYQLLVSPSAVAYLLRQQSSAGAAAVSDERSLTRRLLPPRLRASLYVFALSEGYLETSLRRLSWAPVRRMGKLLVRIDAPITALAIGLSVVVLLKLTSLTAAQEFDISAAFAFLAVALSGISLTCRRFPACALAWVSGSCLAASLSVFVADSSGPEFTAESIYVTTIVVSCALALGAMIPTLLRPRTADDRGPADALRHWVTTSCAFIGMLGVMGFPLLPTFFGEGILLHDAFRVHRMFAILFSSLFALNGYVAMRSFAFAFYRHPSIQHR